MLLTQWTRQRKVVVFRIRWGGGRKGTIRQGLGQADSRIGNRVFYRMIGTTFVGTAARIDPFAGPRAGAKCGGERRGHPGQEEQK